MRNIWSHDGLFYAIIDDNDDEMAPEDVVNELATLRDENARLAAELAAAREALECAFNWAMTEESDPNGGFDIFAEEIVPMIGKVLGRE